MSLPPQRAHKRRALAWPLHAGPSASFSRYVSNSTDAAERQHRLFSYAQDTWRITPKLTLNYGLRWEIYFPQYVNGKNQGGFQSLATGEVLVAGENGIGLNGNVNTSSSILRRGLGLAYQLTPKTVVRLGDGRSYDVGVFGVSFGHNVTQNLPVLANQSLNPANPWVSVFSFSKGPSALTPCTILASQPKGATGNPLLPNGIAPNVLPLTSDNTMRLPVVDAWNLTIEHQFSQRRDVGRLCRKQGLSCDAGWHQLQHQRCRPSLASVR